MFSRKGADLYVDKYISFTQVSYFFSDSLLIFVVLNIANIYSCISLSAVYADDLITIDFYQIRVLKSKFSV